MCRNAGSALRTCNAPVRAVRWKQRLQSGAEGTILGCATSPVIGSITLGDSLPDTDPEIALRIYYAQAGEEVFAVARRFHVAPAQILAANQLEEELTSLPQAQRLLIPVT